ncbi:unnamed protein product [Rhizoctonia solani]|uniref:Uncharacterized protein n=1 Tax=Rhizoctonia solani TaxID=456999 RepID=A0A8H2WSQ5_9AGAM|nr:unnamed protein product [Rhizoctonia solani]
MPLLYELDSPIPTRVWVPSRRQFSQPNAPPPGGVATATQSSAANSPTASLLPMTTTATHSAVNTMSLVYDPTAGSQTTAGITANTTAPKESTSNSSIQSILEKLFTPNGGLFTVGIIIISLAAGNSPSQFAANFNSSPSHIGSSPSETAALGSSFGSANTLGLISSPSTVPYVPADMTAPPDTPTSGVMYTSTRDTFISDPFAYDAMIESIEAIGTGDATDATDQY